MKKILLSLLALALAISMGIVGIGCPTPPDDDDNDVTPRTVIDLDFVTFWPPPPVDFQSAIGHQNWMDTIAARVLAETDDYEIKWTAFYGVHPGTLLVEIADGTYDVGTSGPGYSPGVFPLWAGPEYAADVNRTNALTMSMTVQALYEQVPAMKAEMDASDFQLMHFWSTGPGYFLMTEGNHVTSLADFPGKTIRAANPASTACITALGAEPLFAPMSVALERFEAGLIDGILCPTDTPKGFGLDAYVRSATFAPFSYHFVFFKIMNKDTYAGLPASVRAIVDDVNAKYPEYYGKLRTWGERDGLLHCEANVDGWVYYDWRDDAAGYQAAVDATAGLITDWIAGDTTKQGMWDKFVELDEFYATTAPYSTWTPGANPPPAP